MKIGILGGSFNPPHIGHLILAEYVRDYLELDKVLFIPCSSPPHKPNQDMPKGDTRLKMLNLALRNKKNFEISNIEVNKGGVSYTIDTVRELRKRWIKEEIFFIIGSDLYKEFHTWKSPKEIRQTVNLVVVIRNDLADKDDDCVFVNIPRIEISSSLIRERIRMGRSIKYMVPPRVERYIYKSRLYT